MQSSSGEPSEQRGATASEERGAKAEGAERATEAERRATAAGIN